jgi:hypothetical protein
MLPIMGCEERKALAKENNALPRPREEKFPGKHGASMSKGTKRK